MNAAQQFQMSPQMRRALANQLPPEYADRPTGPWQTFNVVSTSMGASGTSAPTVSFPVFVALFEIQGSAICAAGGSLNTPSIGNLDAFTIQISLPDGTAVNAGSSQLAGTAFFQRLTGLHTFRKPWVVPPNTNLTCSLTNISGVTTTVHLGFNVLLLELTSTAAQF